MRVFRSQKSDSWWRNAPTNLSHAPDDQVITHLGGITIGEAKRRQWRLLEAIVERQIREAELSSSLREGKTRS